MTWLFLIALGILGVVIVITLLVFAFLYFFA